MIQDQNKRQPFLFKNTEKGIFSYSVFAANRQMHHVYHALEKTRIAKTEKSKLLQKTRHKYQQAAKGFFGSSLMTDNDRKALTACPPAAPTHNRTPNTPPFTTLPPKQRFPARFQQPVNNTIVVVPPGTGDTNAPDIILSVSLLLSSPPIPLLTLTMPLNAEISASITMPLNYYDEEADISAIFAVAYTINANLIIAMAFPNDTYTHFTNPTVTLIFGLPINYMSGLSIPVAFGSEGPTYPVLIVNPLATPENPESGDVVVPPDAPFIP